MKSKKKRNKRKVNVSAKRTHKKIAKRKSKIKHEIEVIERYNKVLSTVNAKQLFAQFPIESRRVVYNYKFPPISFKLADDIQDDYHAKYILKELKKVFGKSKATILPFDKEILVSDYFTIGTALFHCFEELCSGKFEAELAATGHFYEINKIIKHATEYFMTEENILRIFQAFLGDIDNELAKNNRMNRFIYWISLKFDRIDGGKPFQQVIIHKQKPVSKKVVIDGQMRTIYRCGQSVSCEESIRWVEWGSTVIEGAHELPVYIQDHVFQRLSERLNCFENQEGYLYDYLWGSLLEPIIDKKSDTYFLVEYRFKDYKLGYLPVTIIDNIAVVKTFIFLTMDGTPEAKKLFDKFKLRKQDKKYLGIDDLDTFLFSDIRENITVREIFEECGCGHLLKLAKQIGKVDRDFRPSKIIQDYLMLSTTESN